MHDKILLHIYEHIKQLNVFYNPEITQCLEMKRIGGLIVGVLTTLLTIYFGLFCSGQFLYDPKKFLDHIMV